MYSSYSYYPKIEASKYNPLVQNAFIAETFITIVLKLFYLKIKKIMFYAPSEHTFLGPQDHAISTGSFILISVKYIVVLKGLANTTQLYVLLTPC